MSFKRGKLWVEIRCFNPIPTEGGPFGPEQPKTVWHFHSFMAVVNKIHDFDYFSTCLVPVKLFCEKKFWNFEKLKKSILPIWHPFGKKSKKIIILFLFQKNNTIFTWIWILHFLSYLLKYIISVFFKILKFSFF